MKTFPRNARKVLSFPDVAEQAQKLSEIAYLEAQQPKHLRNKALIDTCHKQAKSLTNFLTGSGYWQKSMVSLD
tara:strand:- start:343 stop:561 length:219 start_codon:yes stop_codon:yes gene_type:complete